MENVVKTVIITQARTGSTRLPRKVLLKIGGSELLKIHLNRVNRSRLKDEVIVATTTNPEDDPIALLCFQSGFDVYRGSEDDVLDRFYQACQKFQPEWVVRVTSDCPLIDPCLIDAVIAYAQINEVDYCSNCLVEHYPDGQDVEVFRFSTLCDAWKRAALDSDREHVTPYIKRNSDFNGGTLYRALNFPCQSDFSDIRMTIDEQKDFDMMSQLIGVVGMESTWLDYTRYIKKWNLNSINKNIIRNEGYFKSLEKDQLG